MKKQTVAAQPEISHERGARRVKKWIIATALLGLMLIGSISSVIPFLAGHSLHDHFDSVGKYLVYMSMGTLLVFLWVGGMTFASWYYLRKLDENRRRFSTKK